jgi:hypothetical protein
MGLGPNFGMICGVGIQSLRKLFLFYLLLLVRRMHLLRIIWSSWLVPISGARAFLERRMTGKWMSLLLFFQVLHSISVRRGSEDRFW